jgi:hypothetical protein
MRRRHFVKHGLISGAGVMIGTGSLTPRRVNAFIVFFLGSALLDLAFDLLIQGAFDLVSGKLRQRRQEWFAERQQAQLAQADLIQREFPSEIYVAENQDSEFEYILAATREQYLGMNIAFSFPRTVNDQLTVTTFEGPAAIGLAAAAKYLHDNTRMTPAQIRAAIFPARNLTVQPFTDWDGWDSTGLITYPNSYRTGGAGVQMRYEPGSISQGGQGKIEITIQTDLSDPIVLPKVFVQSHA